METPILYLSNKAHGRHEHRFRQKDLGRDGIFGSAGMYHQRAWMFGRVKRGLRSHCTRGREVRVHPLPESPRDIAVNTHISAAILNYRVDSGYRSAMSVQSSLVMHPINEVRLTIAMAWLTHIGLLTNQLLHALPVRLRGAERAFLTATSERRDGWVLREWPLVIYTR
jgi:hypothetical protein